MGIFDSESKWGCFSEPISLLNVWLYVCVVSIFLSVCMCECRCVSLRISECLAIHVQLGKCLLVSDRVHCVWPCVHMSVGAFKWCVCECRGMCVSMSVWQSVCVNMLLCGCACHVYVWVSPCVNVHVDSPAFLVMCMSVCACLSTFCL